MTDGLIVEADFSGTAFGGSPTWTDISLYVHEVNGSWGRADWMATLSPGQFTVALHNLDGRFTPGRSSSPYFPYVRYGVRLRYREVIGATTVYMADGYVTDWDTEPDVDQPWVSTVSVTDIFGRMASGTELRGFLTEEMLADSPSWLYPLQEPEGSTTFGDIAAKQDPATVRSSFLGAGVVDSGQQPDGNFIAGNAVGVTNDSYLTYVNPALAAGSWLSLPAPTSWQMSFETWVQPPDTAGSDQGTIASFGNAFGFGGAGIWIRVNGFAIAADVSDATTSASLVASGDYYDGLMHHVAVTIGADLKTVTLYVDGQPAATAVTSAALGALPSFRWSLGMVTVFSNAYYPLSASYAYTASYPTTLSAARILAHYNAGANGFLGESTNAHVTRILSYRGNLGSNLDTGAGFVGSGDVLGETQQQALLDVGDTEGGVVYTDGQGRIVLRSRSRLFNPTPTVTLNYTQGHVGIGTTYMDSIENTRNDMTVSRVNGADSRYYNQTHINTYGTYTDSKTLDIDTDTNALVMASWLVAQGTLDQLAIPSLSCDLLAMKKNGYATLVTSVLQLAPLDSVQLTNLESRAPAATMNLVVQGGTYTRTPDEWSVQFNTTPAPPAVFAWDDSAHGWDSGAVWAP